ncbi:TPA: hypothetical protein ACIJ2L_003533 [Klebsiella pneumoniae]|uniref:hypothetical protein n=1 Tax=Klebsiella pneumoniae TaxID=573 RepID=UPI00190EAB0C|nr:hypothetical protein [Klebsiella pneumoniae]MBK4963213.1 hypothetical protein [Klebsiella pneumoniae]
MTDVTELAQREKFEVWAHSQKLSLAYGDCGYAFSSTEMAWRAWMASSAELVEALEKAQGMEAYWKTQCRGITDHCEELQARIAELEYRTVTVKLPQRLQPGADGWDDWYVHSDDKGEYLKFDDVLAMLTAAGIKVEAE